MDLHKLDLQATMFFSLIFLTPYFWHFPQCLHKILYLSYKIVLKLQLVAAFIHSSWEENFWHAWVSNLLVSERKLARERILARYLLTLIMFKNHWKISHYLGVMDIMLPSLHTLIINELMHSNSSRVPSGNGCKLHLAKKLKWSHYDWTHN